MRTTTKYLLVSIILSLTFLLFAPRISPAAELKAGAATVDISPERATGISLAGYVTRKSIGVHDPTTARCAVIDDGAAKIAIATVDLIGLFYDDIKRIAVAASESTGIPASNILVHAIHTHSGPDTQGLWGGVSKTYKKKVSDGVASCIVQANNALLPATAWLAQGETEGFNINRRNPVTGKPDTALAVIELRAGDGKAVFTLVNFACHAVVLGVDNLQITSDYVYFLRNKIETARGGTALFVMRDIGDANPQAINADVSDRMGGTFEMAEKLGGGIAARALELLSAAEKTDLRIRIASREISVPVENKQFLGFMKSGLIKRKLVNDSMLTAAAIVDLGEAQIMTIPGEATSEARKDLENILPGPYKFFFGQTQDEPGYILSPSEWDASRYEESMSIGKSYIEFLKKAYIEMAGEIAAMK